MSTSLSIVSDQADRGPHPLLLCESMWGISDSQVLNRVQAAVQAIQQSIGWNRIDWRIAERRLQNQEDLKIVTSEIQTQSIVGYAIIAPRRECEWDISQIAVKRQHQKCGIGKSIMQQVFYEAGKNNIKKIFLRVDSTEETSDLMNFYRRVTPEQSFSFSITEQTKTRIHCCYTAVEKALEKT